MNQLVILAGGRGTRLGAQLADLPKPMIDIVGKPLLQLQIELGLQYGFDDFVLLTGYRSDAIESFFGDGSRFGTRIRYIREEEPLGTAGALLAAARLLADRFMLMYGDTMLDVDLSRMLSFHEQHKAHVTLFVHPNNHPYDSDLLEAADDGFVTALHPKPHPEGALYPNLVNAALYVMNKAVLEGLTFTEALPDIARHAFPEMLRRGVRLFAYRSPEYIRDIGTPDRYARVLADYRNGVISGRSLARKSPAIFLDRDGTLSPNRTYVRRVDEIALVPGAADAVRRINESPNLAVLVTNQPVVARGDTTEDELQRIHNRLESLLAEGHAYLDRIYFCPHHPDKGFPGERADLKIVCACRKPATGMFEAAVRDMSIDVGRSWMIGDSTVDIRAARNAGLRSVLIRTGELGSDSRYADRPDYVFHKLVDAVGFVLEGHARLLERMKPLSERIRPGQWVGIGGLAHSGKSSAASALRECLAARGQRAVIVGLDSWLRSEKDRTSKALIDTYDVMGLQSFLQATEKLPASLTLPRYERATRTSYKDGEALVINPTDVVIVEGVVALHLPELRDRLNLKVFAHVEEPTRRQRFVQDYLWRGVGEADAGALYESRHATEHDVIRATRSTADVVIEAAA